MRRVCLPASHATPTAQTATFMTPTMLRSRSDPQIIHRATARCPRLARDRAMACARERIALVPTMGALHAGHLALVKRAQRRAERVIVSIFVNPAQFAPNEDLKTYPRTFAGDVAALARVNVEPVWAPSADDNVSAGFCDADRAGRPGDQPGSKMRFGRIFSPASRP